MSDMTKWITPLGLKIDSEDVKTDQTLSQAIEIMKNYHKGKYVIGKDSKYCDYPHYHIHFWVDKIVTKGACKTFRSDKLKDLCFSRKTKFSTGQDLPSSDKMVWLGYAVKEEIISIVGFSDEERSDIIKTSQVQLEIKKLKKVHSEKLLEKDKIKKQLKDKLFEYIKAEKEHYAKLHEDEYLCYGLIKDYKIPDLIRKLIIKYFVVEDKYWYIQKMTIERYLKEYLGKYENYNEINFFSMLYL